MSSAQMHLADEIEKARITQCYLPQQFIAAASRQDEPGDTKRLNIPVKPATYTIRVELLESV